MNESIEDGHNGEYDRAMDPHIDADKFDIQKFAESLVEAGREGVRWERKKLEWILEEEKRQDKTKSEAA